MPNNMPNYIDLDIQNPDNISISPSLEELSLWANTAIKIASNNTDDTNFDMTLRIVGETEGKDLNKTYRDKKNATNVLSFPFEAPENIEINLLGDIVICAPVVEKEAQTQHKSPQSHWAHLTIHGTLHLLGFDHVDDNDADIMENLEISAMVSLGFTDPYQDHSN